MNDDNLDVNLSYLLNEPETEEKKSKSNGKYFFYSIFLVIIVYVSIIFFDEIKLIYNNLLNKYILEDTKKELPLTKNEKILPKIKKEKEIKIVEKIVKIKATKEDLINLYNTDNFRIYKCTNYPIHKFQLDNKCKKELEEFLKENKDAFRFEVIPSIGQKDIRVYLKYKAYLEEILMAGISVKRANEMVWNIKQQVPENIIVNPKDYYIKSDDQISSVTVKAYH